ncbi:hypothetical protein [Acidiphilium acidophilum]|uniref:hypothetical protein n=1 Tax=Acidiphilium acidophilum TaxID=76588 RepID=UPI002E8E737A|nr:hypothetical protein [Acidiphilium acidophilum]
MRRLVLCAAASLALYFAAFAFVLHRPLSVGLLRMEMDRKLARGARLASPKLVVLAGSNAPFSHSCRVIGAMLGLPCENGGVAVGIGLDDLFARWSPLLHRGDSVYLPIEIQQYDITAAQNRMDMDGAWLFYRNRALLWHLGALRALAGAFGSTMPDGLEALAEMAAHAAGLGHRRAMLAAQFDREGDRIGTTLATADPAFLATLHRIEPGPRAIADGYGARETARFVRRLSARGVIVIGGLPTDFDTVRLPEADIVTIRRIFTRHGGRFVELPDRSRYPRADFYNSEDHLAQPCQYLHSIAVARALGPLLDRAVRPPGAAMRALAATCPSARMTIAARAG